MPNLCKKCGKPGTVYRVGEVVKQPNPRWRHPVSWYRCFCAFCDDCIEIARKNNPEKIYVPISHPTPDKWQDITELLHDIYRLSSAAENERYEKSIDLVYSLLEKWQDEWEKDLIAKFHQKGNEKT